MIVKNEQDVLSRCLDCIKDIVDEIIIVDTGSTDKTMEIARRYTNKLFTFQWIQDFAAARNFSFSKATKDYILWLDADDVIDIENKQELKNLKETLDPLVDMVMMKYHVAFDENGNPTFSYYRERLLKRSKNYQWEGEIHEVITPNGNYIYKDIAVCHKKTHPNEPERNLKIFENIINQGKDLDPRQKFYYARELYYNDRNQEAIKMFEEFLSEGKGWIENNISACSDLANCYYKQGNYAEALQSYLRSFSYDKPRAEICCNVGKHFLDRNQIENAIYWYELAANSELKEATAGFVSPDCYGYVPNIQLSVCYDRLGEYQKAQEYNEKAGVYKPKDKNYLSNKEYFKKINERAAE